MSETVVEVFDRNRGFHGYGREPLRCSYNGTAEVYESSSAEGPHVWLKVSDGYPLRAASKEGEAVLHLNADQSRELIARLQCWLDEIPSRWVSAK